MPRRLAPDPLAIRVARRIRALRQDKGLSLTALALRAEMSKGHLSNVERGLQKLANGLGVRLHDILISPEEDGLQRLIDVLRGASPRALKAVEKELARFLPDGKVIPQGRLRDVARRGSPGVSAGARVR